MNRSLIITTFETIFDGQAQVVLTPTSRQDVQALQGALGSPEVDEVMSWPTDEGFDAKDVRPSRLLKALTSDKGRRMRGLVRDARLKAALDELEAMLQNGNGRGVARYERFQAAQVAA